MTSLRLRLRKALFLSRLHKGGFFFAHVLMRTRRKLCTDLLDALDEQLGVRFLFAGLRRFLHDREILELRRVRFGQIQRQLRAAGAEQLIQNARGEDDRLQVASHHTAERSRAERGKADRDARLRDERETEIIADEPVLF